MRGEITSDEVTSDEVLTSKTAATGAQLRQKKNSAINTITCTMTKQM